jgi:hypothetical protein
MCVEIVLLCPCAFISSPNDGETVYIDIFKTFLLTRFTNHELGSTSLADLSNKIVNTSTEHALRACSTRAKLPATQCYVARGDT